MASSRKFQAAVLVGIAAAALSGCNDSGSQSSASTGAATPSASGNTAQPPGPVGTKNTVSITGTPATTIKVGQKYAFVPNVAAQGTAQFSIENKPAWTSFDSKSGTLSGTPAAKDVGTYQGVLITAVLNGASATLDPFSVTVQAAAQTPTPAQTPVTLTWTAPSGSGSGQLDGYRIYYGTSASALTNVISLSAGETSYVISNLASGTWYFAMTSLNDSDGESVRSAVVPAEI